MGPFGRAWLVCVLATLALTTLPLAAADVSLVDPLISVKVRDQRLSDILKLISAQSGMLFDNPALAALEKADPEAAPVSGGSAAAPLRGRGSRRSLSPLVQASGGSTDEARDAVDPKLSITIDRKPLGWLLDQIQLARAVRFDRQGSTYTVTPIVPPATVPAGPVIKVDDYALRLQALKINRYQDIVFGPTPNQTRWDDLSIELSVDGASPIEDAATAGLWSEMEATGDENTIATRAPGTVRKLLQPTPVTSGGRAFVASFVLPTAEVKTLTQLVATLVVHEELAERVFTFGDLAKQPSQSAEEAGVALALAGYQVTAEGHRASLTVRTRLNEAARAQVGSLVGATGVLTLPWAQPTPAARFGRTSRTRPPDPGPVPGWLLPICALERADGTRLYASSTAAVKSIVLRGETLETRLELAWPPTKANKLVVSALDPGPKVKELLFAFLDHGLPSLAPPPPAN